MPTSFLTTGEGLTGESPINVSVGYTATPLQNRVVLASPISLGREMLGANLLNVGGITTLTSTGADSQYTRVTVAGTLFNGTISSGTASAIGNIAGLAGNGTLTSFLTTGEGLTGESPINVSVGYTATALQNRVVLASPISLGREMLGINLLNVGGITTLTSTGADSQYTRVTVAGTLFNGTTSSGTASANGNIASLVGNGTLTSFLTTGEGLTGESPINVSVGYTATALQNRVVLASPISLGREILGANLLNVGGITTLTSTGADSQYTRVTVAGTLFNGTTSSGTASANGNIASLAGNGTLTSFLTTGEGLTGESPINVSVGYTATALQDRVVLASPISLGREMLGINLQNVGGITTLTSTGADSQYTRVTVAGTLFNGTTSSGTASAIGNIASLASSGTLASFLTTGEGLTGESPINVSVGYTATALQNRVVLASPISLGREMLGANLLNVGGITTLTSTGADSQYTRVTVAGTLFNGTTSSGTASANGNIASLAGSGTLTSFLTTGEGLTGESPINVSVGYTATALQNRVVLASPINLGREMLGINLLNVGGITTLTSTGADSQYTRVTVAGTLFNGTTSSGTASVIGSSGTLADSGTLTSLLTTGEGLMGESPINVSVGYTATPLQNRVVLASPISLGREMLGANLLSVGGITTLTSTGADSQYTRVTVAGTLFNGTTSSGTASAIGNIASLAGSGTLTSFLTTGEGLTGESPINVSVGYTATPLQNRVVLASPISLGREMLGANLLNVGGITTLTSTGADSQYTRVTVAGTLFNGTTSSGTASANGNIASLAGSGTLTSFLTTGEGLTGESPINVSVGYTATPLKDRIVLASPINLGREMLGINLLNVGGITTLTSTGADSQYTRVTVAGTLFNGTTSSGTASAIGNIASLAGSGTLTSFLTTGEGLTGESPINVSVGYTAAPLQNRVVSASPISLGREMLGANLLNVGGITTLTSTGADSQYTRVTVAGTLFNGTTSSGTASANGNIASLAGSGTLTSFLTTGEGLTGESPINVSVGYTATPLQDRVVLASPISLGREMLGINLLNVGGITTLTSTGADSQYTRVTVAGTLFNGTNSSGTASAIGNIASLAGSGTLTSFLTTGEGLMGESPINVSVGYTATALQDRVVLASPISLGREMLGANLLMWEASRP